MSKRWVAFILVLVVSTLAFLVYVPRVQVSVVSDSVTSEQLLELESEARATWTWIVGLLWPFIAVSLLAWRWLGPKSSGNDTESGTGNKRLGSISILNLVAALMAGLVALIGLIAAVGAGTGFMHFSRMAAVRTEMEEESAKMKSEVKGAKIARIGIELELAKVLNDTATMKSELELEVIKTEKSNALATEKVADLNVLMDSTRERLVAGLDEAESVRLQARAMAESQGDIGAEPAEAASAESVTEIEKLSETVKLLDALGASTEPGDTFNDGRAQFVAGDYAAALRLFRDAAKHDADNPRIWRYIGNALERLGRYTDALDAIDRSIELDPNGYIGLFNKAVVLNRLERFEDALDLYPRIQKLAPSDVAVWSAHANTLGQLSRYEEALEFSGEATELDPENSVIQNNHAWFLFELGRHEEGLPYAEAAVRLNSESGASWDTYSALLGGLGRFEEAIDAAKRATAFSDHAVSWNRLAGFQARLVRRDDALESLRKAIEGDAKYKAEAMTDEAFVGLRDDEEFKSLVE